MKSCKIFTSALMFSIIATSAFAGCPCRKGKCAPTTRRAPAPARRQPMPVQHQQPAQRQPIAQTVIGNGARILGIANSSPELSVFYRAFIDNNAAATWIRTENKFIVIRFNEQLTIEFATDANGSNRQTLNFRGTDLPGKTFLLRVMQHRAPAPEINIFHYSCGKDNGYQRMGINTKNNITPEELTAQLAVTAERMAQARDAAAPEQAPALTQELQDLADSLADRLNARTERAPAAVTQPVLPAPAPAPMPAPALTSDLQTLADRLNARTEGTPDAVTQPVLPAPAPAPVAEQPVVQAAQNAAATHRRGPLPLTPAEQATAAARAAKRQENHPVDPIDDHLNDGWAAPEQENQ